MGFDEAARLEMVKRYALQRMPSDAALNRAAWIYLTKSETELFAGPAGPSFAVETVRQGSD
jgi:hypothetical protein